MTRATTFVVAITAGALAAAAIVAGPAAAHVLLDPNSYAWVRPPPGLDAAGVAEGREVTLDEALLAAGRTDVWTPDVQALVTVEGTAPVDVRLSPRDPADWPVVPDLEVSGNAYEVALGGAVDGATVFLRPPHPVTELAVWDGNDWQVSSVSPDPDGVVAVAWDGPGPYVAAAPRLDGHASTLGALLHDPVRTGLLLLGLTALAVGLLRRRWLAGRS